MSPPLPHEYGVPHASLAGAPCLHCDEAADITFSAECHVRLRSALATLAADVSRLTAERDAMEGVVKAAREYHEDCEQAANHRANPGRCGACAVCDALSLLTPTEK